jgi:SAM-dependent MidA family methyltransferase
MFVIAHELYDALPIHQFKYLGGTEWCEKVVKLGKDETLEYADGTPNDENVRKVLNP